MRVMESDEEFNVIDGKVTDWRNEEGKVDECIFLGVGERCPVSNNDRRTNRIEIDL